MERLLCREKIFAGLGLETDAFGGLGSEKESRGCHTLLGKYLVAFLGPLSSCTADRKVKSCRKRRRVKISPAGFILA
jgi:hypothetical protein